MRDLRQTGYAQQVGPAPAYGGHRVVFVFLLELLQRVRTEHNFEGSLGPYGARGTPHAA